MVRKGVVVGIATKNFVGQESTEGKEQALDMLVHTGGIGLRKAMTMEGRGSARELSQQRREQRAPSRLMWYCQC